MNAILILFIGNFSQTEIQVLKCQGLYKCHIPHYHVQSFLHSTKRDFTLDKQILRNIFKSANILHTPLTIYGTQVIHPFLSLMISAKHDTMEGFQQW